MEKISTKTKRAGADVIQMAIAYFGEGGLGLTIENKDANSITFKGGGGGVVVEFFPGEKGTTNVDLTSREWDFQVKQFLGKIR
jgi:hypothetical protein